MKQEGCCASIASSNLPRAIGIVSKGVGIDMTGITPNAFWRSKLSCRGRSQGQRFAALKSAHAHEEVLRVFGVSEGKAVVPRETRQLWHVKLSSFEPSQFPTCYKTHRMYLCPLGVILLVNNLDNSGMLSVAAFNFDSCLVNTDVKRKSYRPATKRGINCEVVMSQLEGVKRGSLRLATSLASALRMLGQLELWKTIKDSHVNNLPYLIQYAQIQ
ncbi:hypothetical protein SELMODRAFT_406184 [Selaginella moellendorffii]|uniref:Uncharacterized protein n=1 Tax=Selaginella moellendorffii TaxID=88036 RepID=D8R1J5_SELML|nr:hypothetical protein SELMODRAFT_406184 [Selaginella moellendorffii]